MRTTTPATVTGLTGGVTYDYEVRWMESPGATFLSEISDRKTATQPT
jgi:hypothetical protein